MKKTCTKLVQCLTLAGVFFTVWIALVADALPIQISKEVHQVVLIVRLRPRPTVALYVHDVAEITCLYPHVQLPLYLLICFGVS